MTTISPVIVPYSGNIPGGVQDGLKIEIQGTVPHHAHHGFSINLCQGPHKEPTTPLHVNPRFNENCVVLNNLNNGAWGSEERHGLPLQKGQTFQMVIKVKHHDLKIKVNGSHLADFKHRVPLHTAQFLVIDGEVSVNFIRYSSEGHYSEGQPMPGGPAVGASMFPGGGGFAQPGNFGQPPTYSPYPMGSVPPPAGAVPGFPGGAQPIFNPPVPFTTPIPGGMYPGRMITISGVPNQNPSRFTINLQDDPSGSNIALHLDSRFNFGDSHNVVVRNHYQRGQWGKEERNASYFPFMPNANFDILILAEANCFKIAVNNQHFAEFHHHLPLQSVDVLSVSGDVRLTQVRLQ